MQNNSKFFSNVLTGVSYLVYIASLRWLFNEETVNEIEGATKLKDVETPDNEFEEWMEKLQSKPEHQSAQQWLNEVSQRHSHIEK